MGEVRAQVVGSSVYNVVVRVVAVPRKQWRSISADCAGSIDSLVELLQGRLSKAVMERICRPSTGLFPAPKEIQFSCSCPDWASMCKHVAAVLYGVGARLDGQPELIFALRRVDPKDLVAQAGAGLRKSRPSPTAGKVLDANLSDVFGIEMADVTPVKKSASPSHKSTATRKITTQARAAARTKSKVSATAKNIATKPTAVSRNTVAAKAPAKFSASPRVSARSKTSAVITTPVSKIDAVKKGSVSGRSTKKKPR